MERAGGSSTLSLVDWIGCGGLAKDGCSCEGCPWE